MPAIPEALRLAAGANPPARPWGHLRRHPASEPALAELGRALLEAATGRPGAHASLAVGLAAGSDGGVLPAEAAMAAPAWLAALASGRRAAALVAAVAASARGWAAMTGRPPRRMTARLLVGPSPTWREPHFDDTVPGTVVVTLAGPTTWAYEPLTGRVLGALPLIPVCLPGRRARPGRPSEGGLLHGFDGREPRAALICRPKLPGDAATPPGARPLDFDPAAAAALLA
ncbi:MAG TPA: hypothetical protein VEH84_07845 [Alphaproteobacteria bacterium]|nr:hypothetical protein [Alphaproteobacteria bacterium]